MKRAGRMRNTRPAFTTEPKPICKGNRTMAKAKISTKETTALRDALPFFKKGHGKVTASWWHVTPSGSYAADVETGKAYARAFIPLLSFNAGASDLAAIVSDMATAGRDSVKNPKDWRGIDAVALGFMLEIGGALQSAIVGMSVAACAIETPDTDLGLKFVERSGEGRPKPGSGNALHGSGRSTLFHNPNACILEARQ
jgi:hypothetical protein